MELIHAAIQPQSAHRYGKTFERWTRFLALTGRCDPLLRNHTNLDVVICICAYSAWTRADGTWSGMTIMQSLAHIKHHWVVQVRDTSMFSSPSVQKLRKSLKLTDRFDEARKNKYKRLPYGPDMVHMTKENVVDSGVLVEIMTAAGISLASLALMRISEYGKPPKSILDPDHRLYSKNITFMVEGRAQPLNPRELKEYALTSVVPVDRRIIAVNILIVGSKTDRIADGTMLTFMAKDFDIGKDPANSISLWARWACLVDHDDNAPFFSYRDEEGRLVELTPGLVTLELRRVAQACGFPRDQLQRFSPHSVRMGMASHLHNLGVTSTVILQMGRWSPNSNAAQLYQRLGLGACSIVAKSTKKSVIARAHSAADTLRVLVRADGHDDQYRERNKKLRAATERAKEAQKGAGHQHPQGRQKPSAGQGNSNTNNRDRRAATSAAKTASSKPRAVGTTAARQGPEER
jgi:hypothetical protein